MEVKEEYKKYRKKKRAQRYLSYIDDVDQYVPNLGTSRRVDTSDP